MAMASFRSSTPADASLPDVPVSVSQFLKCPICLDKMADPVTTTCGHTFCKPCLDRHLSLSDLTCPLCKKYLLATPSVNIILKALLEEYENAQKPHPEDLLAAPGEVACEICPENRKRRAEKSCLMCLLSYCGHHLKRHQNKLRLKGHKLVAPVEKLDDWACLTHGRPLELYWAKEDKCICSLCVDEATDVVSVETERDRREVELGGIIKELEERIQQREEKVKDLQHSAENCLALIEREEEEIKEVFDGVRKVVAKAEEEALSPLIDRRREVEREMERFKEELQEEISTFSQTISDLTKISQEEDNLLFLQNYPSVPVSDSGKDWTDVTVDTDLTFGTMRNIHTSMMVDIETELEKLCCVVDVTLDPDTANPQLMVSEDAKEVRSSGDKQDVPEHPDRFDVFGSILGQNRLTDGRAFWVVDVGDKQGWDIGLAREDANRKGALSIKPSQGYWAIVLYNGDKYAALEDPPTPLSLQEKPQRVGVFVDYLEGLVSFYDADAKSHIYSFTDCVFNEAIRPYFSPHFNQGDKNSSPLVICPVNHSD
ncbi:E3 ubiquitin-protein ligase TRIM39-like isoform X1 [Astyanax mexicanus]|uniref:E3 ubiquitin-protein ligase TRIM39-like isoform X1 n=1 Tax=Astyanax mexicanus TaxID=7994 RepID=A0A8T2KJT8_ASTMX|nr:E3 ubiquitin-protein ligase TRIM39-like isoform X1 [Astyanax mexicanus]